MRTEIELKCGCKLGFSDTYNHLISTYECKFHSGTGHASLHYMISVINEMIDIFEGNKEK